MREVVWMKSSRSGGASENCVELSVVELSVGRVRDSKNPDGPTLTVDIARFLRDVRAGRLSR